jgi:hypothetical protein
MSQTVFSYVGVGRTGYYELWREVIDLDISIVTNHKPRIRIKHAEALGHITDRALIELESLLKGVTLVFHGTPGY